jgi:hypothetical protein
MGWDVGDRKCTNIWWENLSKIHYIEDLGKDGVILR